MREYRQVLQNNARWVTTRTTADAGYFERLAREHRPQFLFIGCSDARVPADVVTQTRAGELFVHRNIANMVVPTDTNLQAVLHYAIEVLRVQDIIVCGHEGCGGVRAAMGGEAPAAVEHWLANIRTVARLHHTELTAIADPEERYRRLVELNVMEQVHNLSRIPVVQGAWASGQTLRLHGCVYAMQDGLLRDLDVTMEGAAEAGVTPTSKAPAPVAARASRTRRPAPQPAEPRAG